MPELALSLRSLLAHSTGRLQAAGISDPHVESLRMWADLRGLSPAEALLGSDEIDAAQASEFKRTVGRRAAGEPLGHVTGWTGFRYLSLRSDRRALIPRPETEGLVDLLLERVRSGVVIDVGTGSGCIALSLAQEGEFRSVVGIDCSDEALGLARANAELLGMLRRVDFVRGDLSTAVRPAACDALISNPPYLSLDEYAALDASVREWEPAAALVSGVDGLDATARLIQEGMVPLRPGGWLAVEVDCRRARAAAQLASEYGWREVSIYMDLFGRERYLLAQRSETR
jgi:release factor glutamine methyltransferase